MRRVTPVEAIELAAEGAVIIDVRSRDEQERQGGLIPGALHHPLSVLLWRLDPDVETRNPKLPLETPIILVCREGYSSSIAASQLRAIGFGHATDIIGGFDAWLAAGQGRAARHRLRPRDLAGRLSLAGDPCCG